MLITEDLNDNNNSINKKYYIIAHRIFITEDKIIITTIKH